MIILRRLFRGGQSTTLGTADEYASPDLTMKKGRWSMWKEPNGSSLWHQCTKSRTEVGKEKDAVVVYPIKYRTWSFKSKKEIKPRWCCGMCDKKPPESILFPWMIHNFDGLADIMEEGAMGNPTIRGGPRYTLERCGRQGKPRAPWEWLHRPEGVELR